MKKSLKYFLIVAIIFNLQLSTFNHAFAQNDTLKSHPTHYIAHERAYHAEDTVVVNGSKGAGWIRSHFFDEWFFELQGGGQLYYGTDDREGPFGDRLTGNIEFQFGRRIFPMFGFRIGLGYGYAHGFLTKQHYNDNAASILAHGFSGQCGTDAAGNPLGGYFYDFDNDLLIQKWKYFYAGADLFLDLDLFRGAKNYNPYKKFNHIIYGGGHLRNALSETDTTNLRFEANVGYICKYNITPNWGLFADIRGSFIERLFDREWVTALETSGAGLDFVLNAHVGLIYKFHIRTEEERDRFEVTDRNNGAEKNVMTHFLYVKMEEIYNMNVIDTLVSYRQINSPTPETQHLIDSLENVVNGYIDKDNLYDQSLDSILLNQLLPYEMVFFQRDKWDILPSEEMKIYKMSQIMKAYPNETFILTGSADSKTGTPQRNVFLSHNRADVVYNKLVNEYGVPESQLRREYLGGILDYKPFELNRCTVIIMDHPVVQKAFNEMKRQGQAGGGNVEINN